MYYQKDSRFEYGSVTGDWTGRLWRGNESFVTVWLLSRKNDVWLAVTFIYCMLVLGFAVAKLFHCKVWNFTPLWHTDCLCWEQTWCAKKIHQSVPLPSLINGEYKNAPRDLEAFMLFLRSIVKSEILTALFMKIHVFCNVTLSRLVHVYRLFWPPCWFYFKRPSNRRV